MKTRILFLLLGILITSFCSAQFVSVKSGDWRDPLTWSTDAQATAFPDSTNDVIIMHTVIVTSNGDDCRCNNLIINEGATLGNRSSMWTSSNLVVKHIFINRGALSAYNDYFIITVKGNFLNYGTINKGPTVTRMELNLLGDLSNSGSFRNFNTVTFKGYATSHIHNIKSMNDSTIYLNDAVLSDSLGTIIVDSLAIINATTFNLNKGKLVIPPSTNWENKLIFDGGSIMDGTIVANHNTIYTKPNTFVGLNRNYTPTNHFYIQNAILDGNFKIAGAHDVFGVVLQGDTKLTGIISDWYNWSYWSADDRAIIIDGTFTNEGRIYTSTIGTGNGLWISQMPGSIFINKGDSLDIEAHKFNGSCTFSSPNDTLNTALWEGKDTSTTVNILSDIFFRKTVNINLNKGTLNLPYKGKFKTLYSSFNTLRNTYVEANEAEIYIPCTWENVVYNNPNFNLTYFRHDAVLTGQVNVLGGLYPYYQYSPTAKINGDILNKGTIGNHPSIGTLNLEVTGNIIHDGVAWKNALTKINGTKQQFILMPNDSIIKGLVVFESMLNGTAYQWKKDDVVIPNATTTQLSFNSGINNSHYGVYQCFVDGNPSRTITVAKEKPAPFSIFDVQIKNIGLTSTMIQWKTSAPAKGFVFYAENDQSNGYPLEAMENDSLVTEHQIILEELTRGSTYYFIIDQNDVEWNNIRSEEYSFIAGDLAVGAVKIGKIWDVPEDQGRWVFVQFDADMLDATGEIQNYGIWEWMDNDWVSLGSVQATQSSSYTYLARTYSDSTDKGIFWSKFRITAHTINPQIYFTSVADSGYSVDNLVPSIPTGLQAMYRNGAVDLSWNPNPDPDIQYYIVYRFGQILQLVQDNHFTDIAMATGSSTYDYQISAVDFNGNESTMSATVSVHVTSLKQAQDGWNKMSNSPNPFTESTTIRFYLPETTMVKLCIMDLTGKEVKLIMNETRFAGNQEVLFQNNGLKPGIYIYQLTTNNTTCTNKMVVQ